MTLGTAANNSTIKDNGSLIIGGANSERNIAIPILIGTAKSSARNDVIKVP